MSIGVRVGYIVDEVGDSSFFNAFFSTIAVLLEKNEPGSRFPEISINLYNGIIEANNVKKAIEELHTIQKELALFPPSSVIWDSEDLKKQPPWGKNISKDITSMANYFVSSTGRDLFELLFESFEYSLKKLLPITIETI